MDISHNTTQRMSNMKMGDGPHSKGHAAIEKLIESTNFTHRAVKSGLWSDPGTWAGGKVPGDGAKVMIGNGKNVIYNEVSDERIETIAIEGKMTFAVNSDTKLYVETIINAPEGKLAVGSEQQAVSANSKAQIIFTSDRNINRAWDPTQLSKGLVSHGDVTIHGAKKQEKVTLVGDAKAGSNSLTFKENLTGWKVGDRIVLAGTQYNPGGNDQNNSRFQDEVLTITEIRGKQIKFVNEDIRGGNNTVLRYDHVRSDQVDANQLNLYAANLSRNVSFETENGASAPIGRRAHVMLMHNPNVSVQNAGFYQLGRSDKTKVVDDAGKNIDGSGGGGRNPRGRYSLHLHRTGADDLNGQAAIVRGNAVEGSPGWGIVQHDSHAGVEDNVVFDVVGAGIAAESGNEIGWWTDNFVVKSTGVNFNTAQAQKRDRSRLFDFGNEGDGYWVQGAAQVRNLNNKAASVNNVGLALFGSELVTDRNQTRDKETILVKNLDPKIRGLFAGQEEVDVRDIPMADVVGFESYNAETGIQVWNHQLNLDGEHGLDSEVPSAHNGRSLIKDFKVWGNRARGTTVEYSSNIDLKNGTIIGQDNRGTAKHPGIFRNAQAVGGSFDNVTIAGFHQGMEMEYVNARNDDAALFAPSITNSRFINNDYNIGKVGNDAVDEGRPDDYSAFIQMANNRFEISPGNKAPTARFTQKALGGLAFELDAGESADPDPLKGQSPRYALQSKGIAAYGWDLDNNGTLDQFGRQIKHTFDRAGTRRVGLTVLDSQGQATTTTRTIDVKPIDYQNAFLKGNFDQINNRDLANIANSNSIYADKGWFADGGTSVRNGTVLLSKNNDKGNILGQVVYNQKVHRGQQNLNFKLKNINSPNNKNEIAVTLWGVNGEFDYDPSGETSVGPQQVGTLPMERRALVSQTIGGTGSESFDWKDFSLNANLGNGYDYLLVQVSSENTRDRGDSVAIEDISLTNVATTAVTSPTVTSPIVTPPTVTPPDTAPDPSPVTDPVSVPGPVFSNGKSPLPVVQLKLDEGSGQIARDTSKAGKNNNARLSSGMAWVAGKFGGAVALDGKDNIAFRPSEDIDRDIYPERTVSMWFKADELTAGKQVLFEEGNGDRGLNAYIDNDKLFVGSWNQPEANWKGDWMVADGLSANQWHHLAIVLDGTDTVSDDALIGYLDGKAVGSADAAQLWAHTGGVGVGGINQSTRFREGVATGAGYGLSGAIDEVKIFNSALSGEQVQQLAGAA